MTIKQLAALKCKPQGGRSVSRSRLLGYQQGALDALKEIETRIEMGRHASMQTAETILASVEMTIKELKGE